MDQSTNYKFDLPSDDDFYDIKNQNENWNKVDEELKRLNEKKADASGGDISETMTTVEEPTATADKYPELSGKGSTKTVLGKLFRWAKSLKEDKVDKSGGDIASTKVASLQTSTVQYPVPEAGDTTKVIIGKIKKFFEDIRNTATGACYIGQIVNNCVTSRTDLPLSAAQGKVLMDLYNVLNANKTNVSDFANGAIGVSFKNNIGSAHVEFKKMKNIPAIFLTPFGANPKHYNVSAFNVSNTGFDVHIYVSDVADGSITVFWAAMTRNI